MSISPKELREYCRPMLRRKGFRFSRLHGLIDEDRRSSLEVAKAFAQPGGQSAFLYSLRDAPETLGRGIRAAIDRKQDAQNGAGTRAQLALLSEIQKELIAHGVYSEFGRPSTTGVILNSRLMDGMPVYFVLSEPTSQTSIFCGRLTINGDGSRHMAIFVSGAAARLMEIADIWLRTPKGSEDDLFERKLMRTDRASLESFIKGKTLSPEDTPFLVALNVISMRSCIERLRSIALSSGSPQEFLLAAINSQLDSVLAHETAHLEERKANGSIPVHKETREILAYLLEAVHGRADDAFQSLLCRHFDFGRLMPRLEADVRSRGISVFLEDSRYLAGWAQDTLDERFQAIAGRPYSELVDVQAIRSVQTTDYIGAAQMPLMERAMYNPSNFRRSMH